MKKRKEWYMYTVNELPSWYDNWKTGGFGEDDRENEGEENDIMRCDICYERIEPGDEVMVDGEYWCEKCASEAE